MADEKTTDPLQRISEIVQYRRNHYEWGFTGEDYLPNSHGLTWQMLEAAVKQYDALDHEVTLARRRLGYTTTAVSLETAVGLLQGRIDLLTRQLASASGQSARPKYSDGVVALDADELRGIAGEHGQAAIGGERPAGDHVGFDHAAPDARETALGEGVEGAGGAVQAFGQEALRLLRKPTLLEYTRPVLDGGERAGDDEQGQGNSDRATVHSNTPEMVTLQFPTAHLVAAIRANPELLTLLEPESRWKEPDYAAFDARIRAIAKLPAVDPLTNASPGDTLHDSTQHEQSHGGDMDTTGGST